MRTRLTFLAICSLLLSLLTTTTPANSSTSNLEIFAVIDSKPGEVELTFISKIAAKSITSYQITAKPKSGTGLTFTNSYTKKASGYITQKISPLSTEVEYLFTITITTTGRKVIKSAPFTHLVSSTVPSTPLITKVEATDADEAVVFFTAPKDDGGTPIYYYTVTSNPGAISVIAPIQGSGSVTVTGLTKATTYTFTLTAHNINGSSRAATSPAPITTLAEKIVRTSPSATTNAPTLSAPAFTLSSSSETRTVNTAATGFTINSTGGAIASFAINATPPGMSFNTTTGALTGTPNTVAAATNYTITATNASGSATRTFTLTVTAVVYTVGQTGPGGGKVFYVATTAFSCGPTLAATCTYLEAASTTATTNPWTDVSLTWSTGGNQSISVPTATGTAIGTGYKNSLAIVAQSGNVAASSAAVAARAYGGPNALTDWFLPSKDELNQLRLAQTTVGGLVVNGNYWSSTEGATADDAWYQFFGDGGTQISVRKSNPNSVRPVRAF
jgi:hypothetical protein